jgi:hypothetical protein
MSDVSQKTTSNLFLSSFQPMDSAAMPTAGTIVADDAVVATKNKDGDASAFGAQLIEEETAETGGVKWAIYVYFFGAIGPWFTGGTILFFTIYQSFQGSNSTLILFDNSALS